VRRAAAEVLGDLDDPAAVPALVAALEDDDREVTYRAAVALGAIGDDEARGHLLGLVDRGTAAEATACAAVLGLAQGGDVERARIIELLDDGRVDLRWAAATALGKLGGESAVPALAVALGDESADVRAAAARALGGSGDARAVSALAQALTDERDLVRGKAAQALARLRSVGGASALAAAIAGYGFDQGRALGAALGDAAVPSEVAVALADVAAREARASGERLARRKAARERRNRLAGRFRLSAELPRLVWLTARDWLVNARGAKSVWREARRWVWRRETAEA
jgi:HEAT repeat protein